MMKYLSVAVVVCLIGSTGRPEDKPDYGKLIVGKWEVTKAAPDTVPEGAIIEFTKDGKWNKKGDDIDKGGTYTLDGDKLKINLGDMEKDVITIVKISETEMNIKDSDGKEVSFKRKK